jgi:hypothetical protein
MIETRIEFAERFPLEGASKAVSRIRKGVG